MVVQSDGKIVAVGDIDDGTGVCVMAVARFNADGSADTTFGTSGVTKISFVSGADAHGYGLALQPDGKIVVAGDTWVDSTNQTDLAVARLNSDGSLDTSFGTGGKATTDWGHGADHAYAVAVGPDGTVVAAGTSQASGTDYFSVTRYTPAGALDTSFGPDGHVTAFTSSSKALAVRVDGLGRVTAAGTSGGNFALLRLNADGSADGSFGSSGQITTDFGTSGDTAYAAAFTPAGDVLAAGTESGTGGGDFAVARYAAGSGTLDQRLYAQQDANYNVTSLTNAAGTVVQRFVYDPYGSRTVLGSGWGTTADAYDWHVGFQGMWLDTATGLYHTLFRDYSPALGRWMQRDPAGYVDGGSLYGFARSNPAKYRDPNGLRVFFTTTEPAAGKTTGDINVYSFMRYVPDGSDREPYKPEELDKIAEEHKRILEKTFEGKQAWFNHKTHHYYRIHMHVIITMASPCDTKEATKRIADAGQNGGWTKDNKAYIDARVDMDFCADAIVYRTEKITRSPQNRYDAGNVPGHDPKWPGHSYEWLLEHELIGRV